MTDSFDIDARVADRLEALGRVLTDPTMTLEAKRAELECAYARIDSLERARPLALALDVLADLAVLPKVEQ